MLGSGKPAELSSCVPVPCVVSSKNFSHRQGVWGSAKGLDLRLFHKQVRDEEADGGTHGCTLNLFVSIPHGGAITTTPSYLTPSYTPLYP